jgi:hypothetical protein
MSIKKLSGSLAVAIAVCGLSGAAMADCEDVIIEIERQADALRCEPDGLWDASMPIWQYRGKKGDGCVLHEKLARKLDEERAEPPPKRNKKGTNTKAGAAEAFAKGQYEEGLAQLQEFIDELLYSLEAKPDMQAAEDALVQWGVDIYTEASNVCMP